MNKLLKLLPKTNHNIYFQRCCSYLTSDLFEPDYLQTLKSKIPCYDTLNVNFRGYDYPVLESYQKFIHRLAENMNINVEDSFATPAQSIQIVTYKPSSDVVNAKFDLKCYERNVQISDVTSLQLSNLLRALEASTPAGVTVSVIKNEEHIEENRYVPDNELISLKHQLEGMGGARKK